MLTLGPDKNLTFPSTSIGSSVKNLNSIVEGNNSFCQDLISLNNPILGISSTVFNRMDSNGINELLISLNNKLIKYHLNWNGLNILNNTINESGVNYLKNFRPASENDVINAEGFYFLNSQPFNSNFKKLLNIKLLKSNFKTKKWPGYILNQNSTNLENTSLRSHFNYFNLINLPNNSFFESTGSFYNTEGNIKTTVKFINSKTYTKEDWQILRKIFVNCNKITFIKDLKRNSIISFNLNSFIKFKKYTQFLNIATSNLNLKQNIFNNNFNKNSLIIKKNFKNKVNKVFKTKLKIWLNDFYTGGNDSYSSLSLTMINCSKTLRIESHNFSHI